jgi:hypothetical protein
LSHLDTFDDGNDENDVNSSKTFRKSTLTTLVPAPHHPQKSLCENFHHNHHFHHPAPASTKPPTSRKQNQPICRHFIHQQRIPILGTNIAPQHGMLSLIISTIMFFLASFLLHRYLEDWGLDKGKARMLLVLTVASLLSYGAMALVDHFTGAPSLMDTAMKMTHVDIR